MNSVYEIDRSGVESPRPHRVLGHHLVHREVLPHVAQEVEQAKIAEPVGIVHQQCPRVGVCTAEVEETFELTPDGRGVGTQLVLGQQGPLLGLATGVANEAGTSTGEDDGPVTGMLQSLQRAHLHQMPHVQAVRRRVEPAVRGEPTGVQSSNECRVGQLVDQPPESEVVGECGHHVSLPRRRGGGARPLPCAKRPAPSVPVWRGQDRPTPRRGAHDGQPVPARKLRAGARGVQRRPRAAGDRVHPPRPRRSAVA